MDGEAVSLGPDLCGGDVCGVDGAAPRVRHREPALPHVLGSDDGRISGGHLQVQYRVRGLAQAAASRHPEPHAPAGLATEGGGHAAVAEAEADLAQSIRDLGLVEDEEEEDYEDDEDVVVESLRRGHENEEEVELEVEEVDEAGPVAAILKAQPIAVLTSDGDMMEEEKGEDKDQQKEAWKKDYDDID